MSERDTDGEDNPSLARDARKTLFGEVTEMPLAVNDIIQITSIGFKEAQTVLWVLHYKVITAPSTGTPANNLDALLHHMFDSPGGTLIDVWEPCNTDDTEIRRARAQVVAPSRAAYVEINVGIFGVIGVNPTDTANLSWVFVKQSEFAGRRGRGTAHMVLPTFDWVTNGELNATGQGARSNLMDVVDDNQVPALGGVYQPIIYHPGFSPNSHNITHCTQKPEVRTMRRRTVRYGI
jgi:hypothetical protein